MTNTLEFPNQYIVPYQPSQENQPINWVCMDDRFALMSGLYRQIGGGAAGVGFDWAIGRELQRQRLGYGSELAQAADSYASRAPAQILGGIATKEAQKYGINLHTHTSCAAELGAVLVAETIGERPEEVLTAAQQMKPDVSQDDFEAVKHAFNRSLVNYTLMHPDEGANLLDNGATWNGTEIPPVQRVSLADMDHVAQDIGANQQTGVAFDVRSALENDTPAYHISFGDFRELHAVVDAVAPVRFEDFLTVSAIRHGAISLLLPRPTGEPLRVHTISA